MTPRFKWLSQYEVRPLAGVITKKFTMKMVTKRKSLKAQTPIHPNLILIQRRITRKKRKRVGRKGREGEGKE
jgi:hypothetical protein